MTIRMAGILTAIGAAAAAHGATLQQTSAYMGSVWGDRANWTDGAVPDDVPGSAVDTGSGSPEVRMDMTNRVVGKVTTTYGAMPAAGGYFRLSNLNGGFAVATGDAPQTRENASFALPPSTLTFDNGGAGAVIRIDDGTLGSGSAEGGDGTSRQPYRHLYDVPVVLNDSLLIDLNFASTDKYGLFTATSTLGGIWGVLFSQKVTGAKGRDITIDATSPLLPVVFTDDANDFEGDVRVTSGLLQALDVCGLPREGTPFGRNNKITATGGKGRVDLGGFITGEGQTLEISGCRTDGSVTCGVLFSSWARADAFAEWRGAVSLAGDTWIGGQFNGTGWPNSFYPSDTPGDLAITGEISDKDAPAAVLIVNGSGSIQRTVRFGAANSFSDGLRLVNGYFNATRPEAFGTGGVFFDGGTYRFMADGDANVFEADLRSCSGDFKVKVDAGVTATASPAGFAALSGKNFYKYGQGTLVLTNRCHSSQHHLYAGKVVFDTHAVQYVKFGTGDNSWSCDYIHLYNDVTLVATGDEAVSRMGSAYFSVASGSGLSFRAEKNQTLYLMPEGYGSGLCGYATVETDGLPSSRVAINTTPSGRAYPDNCDWLICGKSSWATRTASSDTVVPVPDSAYATAWDDASGTTLVDVTPSLAAESAPAGQVADCLRFNTPNGGAELVLNLAGDLTLEGHTILVTPEMGTTPIRIAGGALKSSGYIRILNFNTNATLTVESDVAATGGSLALVAGGPGKTVLRGAKSFDREIYVIGGVLGADCADALGRANAAWNSGYVYLSNGGTVEAVADFDPVKDATTRTEFGLRVSETGGGIGAAEGATLTLSANLFNHDQMVQPFKVGKGTVVFAEYAAPQTLDVREGTVRTGISLKEAAGSVVGRDGVTLVGKNWASPMQTCTGGGARAATQGKRQLRAEGDVTVDLDGETLNWNDFNDAYNRLTVTEFFDGTGTVHLVDRSAAQTAKVKTSMYRDGLFRGTISAEVPVTGTGLKFPHATWRVPAGFVTSLDTARAPFCDAAFARLTGDGTFAVSATQSFEPAYLTLGDDGAPAADFAGTLSLRMGAGGCSAVQLVKAGDSVQRISGTANTFDGHTIVRAGALLAGADSPATAGASGAFGQTMVYVGDAQTPDDAEPSFLADGPYAIANAIRVHATSPASARPTIGGTAAANGATFSGEVTLYRDAAVTAGAGAEVAFTGKWNWNGFAVAKAGEGTVTVAGDVRVNAWSGGLVKATGKMTFVDGTVADVSSLPESAFADETKRLVLAQADGGLEGAEAVTLRGLPPSAVGWRLVSRNGKLQLVYPKGLRVIVR